MTKNSTVTWVRRDASWSQSSAIEVKTTDTAVPDAPYVDRGGSSLPILYSSTNPDVAAVRSMTGFVTLLQREGQAVITADLPADGQWSAASASYTLIVYDPNAQIALTNATPVVVKVDQTLTLVATMMLGGVDTGFPLSARNTANNYFSYAVGKAGDTGTANIDSRSGSLTGLTAGSVTVTVTLHSTRQYAVMSAEFVVTVEKGDSVLRWASPPAASIKMGETFTPTVSHSGSTAAVVYSSSAPGVATIDAATGVITPVSVGSTIISAVLAGDSNYNIAPTLTYTLTVEKGVSVLSWVGVPVTSIKMGETLAPVATSHSGSTTAVSYSSDNDSVAMIDPATGVITLKGVGSSTISAVLLNDANYQAAPAISYTLTVNKGNSTLSWVSTPAASIKMGLTPSTPQVSQSGSTTAVSYSSNDASVATIDPATGVIKLIGVGNVTISATLLADANYQAAPAPINYTFTVEKGDSTLSWASTPAASVYMGDVLPPFVVSRSGSTTAVDYRSSNLSVAKIDASGAVILCGLGTTTITAELVGDRNYYAAPATITYDITVRKGDVTVSLLYSPFSVYVNEKLTLVPVAKRTGTGTVVVDDLTYHYAVGKAGDTGTATIDAASGVLTGVVNGSVTVTVTCTSNLYQVTGTECTVAVLASSCVVSVPAATVTIKRGGGNDPSYQIAPTASLNGIVARNGAPYGSGTYNFTYSYALSDVSPVGSVTLSPGGLITGAHFGTATVTITVTFSAPVSLSASTTLLVSVIDGNPNTPRPTGKNVDYPAYTGSEPPQLEAVQALLDDLMPVAPGQTHDDPNSTAAQLFGLDLSYFENIQADGKKIVFPINEANDIYQMSCNATSYLHLKATKELVLGDNMSFTYTRGNTFNVNLNINNKVDKDSKEMTGHGVTSTSITGVAAELQLKSFSTYEDTLYPYQKNPGTEDVTNSVYLPKLSKLKLDYGRINSSRRDRVVKLEFLGPDKANGDGEGHDKNDGNLNTLELKHRDPYRLKPEGCAYAEFTQITDDGFKPYKGASKGVSAKGKGNPNILPEENHLGLLGDYFHDETNGGKAMAQYDTIDLPDYVLNDDLFDTTQVDGGVNFLQFRKGKGRLRHEYMDNTIKMLQKAKAVFNINIAGGIRDFFVAGVVSELDFSATLICHSWISPVGFNHTVCAVSTNTNFYAIRSNGSYTMINCENYVLTTYVEWLFGGKGENIWLKLTQAQIDEQARVAQTENSICDVIVRNIQDNNDLFRDQFVAFRLSENEIYLENIRMKIESQLKLIG